MRELPLSLPEKKFVLAASVLSKRIDGRKLDEFRPYDIQFGKEWGSCFVKLGQTQVLANVSCDVQQPQAVRPNEGLLFINVEVTAMAAPHLAGGSRSELGVHLNRMLEKCLKESKAVDLEALCIVADEKVWALRLDVNVINHEGNLLDCCSVAALAALAHFKRPDVTMEGPEVIIHDPAERDAIPITLHHYPLCVSFAYFSNEDKILSDPTALEERVADATLVLGVNAYRELCSLYLGGSAVLAPRVILRCATHAALRAKQTVEFLKTRLAKDLEDREAKLPTGFASYFGMDRITSVAQDQIKIQQVKFGLNNEDEMEVQEVKTEVDVAESCVIADLGDNTAEMVDISTKEPIGFEPKYGEGGPSQWIVEIASPPTVVSRVKKTPKPVVETIVLEGDSDEETVHVLDSKQLEASDRVQNPNSKKRKPKKKMRS